MITVIMNFPTLNSGIWKQLEVSNKKNNKINQWLESRVNLKNEVPRGPSYNLRHCTSQAKRSNNISTFAYREKINFINVIFICVGLIFMLMIFTSINLCSLMSN
uniref:Uncharacterized protein n=1 Tax=Glossina austeni TaxID=7395 RepID=A0A1A9VWK3_GLOAU